MSALRIRDDKRLTEAGITVEAVEPENIRIFVDQIVTKKFRVEAADPRRFGTPPVFEPAEVTVSGPERVLGNPANALRLEADVAAAQRNGAPPTDREVVLRNVKLTLVGADETNIAISPPTVTATVTPVAPRELVLNTVRLFPAGPAEIINSNEVTIVPATLTGVRVSGPAEAIEKLEAAQAQSQAPWFAYVQVQSIPSPGEGDAPFELQLPPGVVSKEERKTVRVTLKPRSG